MLQFTQVCKIPEVTLPCAHMSTASQCLMIAEHGCSGLGLFNDTVFCALSRVIIPLIGRDSWLLYSNNHSHRKR